MNLKDLKLNDMIKVALAVTAIIAVTFNIAISSNNTTTINNYIQESTKKLDTLQKSSDDTQSNITGFKADINKTIEISKEILNEVG